MYIKKLHEIFLASGQNVCTDTRKIVKDSVFFALKGDNFNGNQFASKALDAGCAYAVVDERSAGEGDKYFFVEDVLQALQQLANYHRKQFDIPVIGITGSNGKTTTKELVNAVLTQKFKVLCTHGNLNNHIGVPLTLLGLTKDHEMAVIEMGANHQGEIDALCRIAEPGFGVITNIGKAHLEGFGGIEGVKKGKSELYRFLKEVNGTVFVHGDDEVLMELCAQNNKVTYGTKKLYDVVGKYSESNLFVELAWRTRYTADELKDAPYVKSNIVGVYNYYNALCAACIGNYFKVEDSLIQQAIEGYIPTNNRSQLMKTENNVLILDYYNANPSSMSLAIDNFSQMHFHNKMLVLGDMLELGEDAFKEHALILQLLREKQLEDYILVGPIFAALQKEKSFTGSEQAADFLKKNGIKNKTILVKGSRGIALEKVVNVL
jgi:UDP-N-acetylmuramoyl-tripeptide--D-alanyl-D-alanine ligase